MLNLAEMLVLRKFKVSAQALKGCVSLSLTCAQFLSCSEKRPVCISSLCFSFFIFFFVGFFLHWGKKIKPNQILVPRTLI